MKKIIALTLLIFAAGTLQAQLLNKIKQKAEKAVTKPKKTEEKKEDTPAAAPATDQPASSSPTTAASNTDKTKSPASEFDFIPGNTVLYADNFEKDKNGDLPKGWITSSSAEVIGLDGLDGKWLKMVSKSTWQISRSKKQSWGTDFTIEFDLVMVKDQYDPRIGIALINTKGNLVTDEKILQSKYISAYVGAILGDNGKTTRVSLYKDDNINHPFSDAMSEQLLYSNMIPVHIRISVQGKRFRFWWNTKKIYDAQIINPQFVPNQFGFDFGPVGGSDFYVSNIRIANDIPATRNPEGSKPVANVKPTATEAGKTTNPGADVAGSAVVKLQSKILNIELPYAQIMKTGDNTFTFSAGKEEGNYKENFIKLFLSSPNTSLKTETFNFREINEKNALYGTKQFPEITKTEAVLFYGTVKKPYIYKFSPRIANGHMATYVSESLERKLPAATANCKFVIEKIENGKASGYFVFGMMNQGLKPITKGDAMTETFTDGFTGEVKGTFSNVPVY
jgi:hypothetical protein